MPTKITADLVIQKFIETRDKIAEIEKECKAKVSDLKAMIENQEFIPGHLIRLVAGDSELTGGTLAGNGIEEDEEEIEQPPPPKRVPTGTTTCPRCTKRFEPDEVVEYTDFGVRCPYCSQSIVL